MNKFTSLLLLKSDTQDSRSGFTLVEILLVVAILGVLAGVAVVNLTGRMDAANKRACRASIDAISTAVSTYEIDNGIFPQTLQNLMTKANESNWNGPYLKQTPADPWGAAFSYSVQGGVYKISSAGPDGQAGSADDITN